MSTPPKRANLDVLFLNPPRRADGSRTLFNNATLTLASYLHKKGLSTRTEPLTGPYWLDTLHTSLSQLRPRTVAVSCKWWDTLYGATEVARLVRRQRPRTKLVTGGQTATSFDQDLITRTEFDAVVRGDGERPLLDYARGKPSSNLLTKRMDLPIEYVQKQGDGEDLRLLEDLTQIAHPITLQSLGFQAPFIWTGKGCKCACMFCAGSAYGHKLMFGRRGYLYRPFDDVLHDMQVMAPWSDDSFLFDFDPVAQPQKGGYYTELFSKLEKGRYHLAFYCWSLPDPELVDFLADRFASVLLSLDAQTFSQPLRERLAAKNQLKPARSNRDFEAIIRQVDDYTNMDTGIYGILGLPGETKLDVRLTERWIDHLLKAHGDAIGEIGLTPLSIEPGALLDRDPDKYGMTVVRKTFEDYMEFTGLHFHNEAGIHDAPIDPNLPHPYGCYSQREAPQRVHNDYTRIQEQLDGTFAARQQQKTERTLRILPEKIQLTLSNRNRIRNVWHLVVWAAGLAVERGLPLLEIDARTAFVFMPSGQVLSETGSHDYTLARLPRLVANIRSRRLRVCIFGRQGQEWGPLKAAGAEVFL